MLELIKKFLAGKVSEALDPDSDSSRRERQRNRRRDREQAASDARNAEALAAEDAELRAMSKSELNDELLAAVEAGDEGRSARLIELGANVNAKITGTDGNSLCAAVENAQHSMVGLLLEKGARVDFKDEEERTPLMLAALYADNGAPATMKLLLEKGADTGGADYYGKTLLMLAAEGGNLKTVDFVLGLNGVSLDAVDEEEQTALAIAESWAADDDQYEKIVARLKSAGAN